jgi:hypothetical protein
MKIFFLSIFLATTLRVLGQTSTMNYVTTQELQVEVKDPLAIPSTDPTKVKKTIVYYDGLGRPLQSVIYQASPKKFDIVQHFVYDAFGREGYKYLPYTSTTSSGAYVSNPLGTSPQLGPIQNKDYTLSAQYKFYNNNADNELVKDEYPLSRTVFESSPLSRPIQDYGAGKAWSEIDANKYIKHEYLVNVSTTEKIHAFQVDQTGNLAVRPDVAGYVKDKCYESGQLSIKVTTDEQGNAVREYADKSGKLILKKVQAVIAPSLTNEEHWAQTYYIYDDFGNLVMVLPPEATRALLVDLKLY